MAVSDPPTSRAGGADATAATAGRPTRDLTLDVLRGAAMVIVVVNHIELSSLFNLGTRERLGSSAAPTCSCCSPGWSSASSTVA